MISIFSKYNDIEATNIEDTKLRYVTDRLESEIEHVKEYYRYRDGKVLNNNMLVRLITTSAPDYNKDIFDFIRILDSTAIYNSKTFDIVSNIHKGSILESVIFGYNSHEIFLYEEEEIDIMSIEDNWLDLKPLKIIKYDGTDINLTMPSKEINFDKDTLSIFKIDVRMLILQYRFWALERINKDFSTDPASFIYSIVFPNMIEDILNHSIINRLEHMIKNKPIIINNHQHPFNILDMNSNINKILKNTIKYVKYQNKSYTNIMKNVHLINNDMYNMAFEPELGNKQSRWVYFLAKIPYLKLLFSLSNEETYKRNKDTINELRILIKQIERDRTMDHIDNMEIEMKYQFDLEDLKQIIKEL